MDQSKMRCSMLMRALFDAEAKGDVEEVVAKAEGAERALLVALEWRRHGGDVEKTVAEA